MRIVLESWDDELEVVTSKGTSLYIRPVEIKKQHGVAGTTDQLELTADLPVWVGKPFRRGINENYDRPDLPDTRRMASRILIGADHWAEVEPTDLVEEEEDDDAPPEREEWLLELG